MSILPVGQKSRGSRCRWLLLAAIYSFSSVVAASVAGAVITACAWVVRVNFALGHAPPAWRRVRGCRGVLSQIVRIDGIPAVAAEYVSGAT